MTTFETGATSHAVNDLILFTDNTSELAGIRDRIYSNAFNDNLDDKTLVLTFEQLFNAAKNTYCKQFPADSCKHIRAIDMPGILEFSQLFANDFQNWLADHDMYQLKRDDTLIYKGLENECYYKLQRVQSNSANWAMRYEGYTITKI